MNMTWRGTELGCHARRHDVVVVDLFCDACLDEQNKKGCAVPGCPRGQIVPPDIEEKKFREVASGSYKVSRCYPKLRSTTTVEIEAYGSVLSDAKTEFSKRFEKNWDGSAHTS